MFFLISHRTDAGIHPFVMPFTFECLKSSQSLSQWASAFLFRGNEICQSKVSPMTRMQVLFARKKLVHHTCVLDEGVCTCDKAYVDSMHKVSRWTASQM